MLVNLLANPHQGDVSLGGFRLRVIDWPHRRIELSRLLVNAVRGLAATVVLFSVSPFMFPLGWALGPIDSCNVHECSS